MFRENSHCNIKGKNEILDIVNSSSFKDLFLNHNITNVIIFGSLSTDYFNEESDIDIAIIANNPISFNTELILTQELENLLERDIDLIDINDPNINNIIKIQALNSAFIVLSDNLLDMAIDFYDNLAKENEEFWRILDREVLGIE